MYKGNNAHIGNPMILSFEEPLRYQNTIESIDYLDHENLQNPYHAKPLRKIIKVSSADSLELDAKGLIMNRKKMVHTFQQKV